MKVKEHKRYYAPIGTHFLNEYQEQIVKGKKELVKVGEKDVYAMIQEDLEGTKIENILHAVAMGDLSALQQRDTIYADATTMPKTLMEAQNLVIKLQDEFYKLPLEVRKEFDNSPEKYVDEMGTKTFIEKMAPYNEKIRAIEEAGSMKEYEKKVKAEAKFQKDVEAAKGVKDE